MTRGSKVLALVCAGTFLTALDVTIVNVAYRDIGRSLGDSVHLPWIISGYSISFAAGLLTAGRMADSFGRKRAFLTGITVFSVASMLCGLALNVPMLIGSRLLQAMGAALIVPSAIALMLPEFPVERRAAAVGITASSGGLGAASGPILGGIVVEAFGWRGVFFINVPICIIAVVIGRRLLRESRDRTSAGKLPDFLGSAMALVSVALVTLALVQSGAWGVRSVKFVGAFVVAIVLGVAFVRRTRRQAVPTLDLALFKLDFVVASNVAGVLYAAGFYSFNFAIIQWLREVWEYSPIRAGFGSAPTPMLSMLIAPFGGRLAQRYGHKRVAVPGLILFGLAGLLARITVEVQPSNYWTSIFPVTALMGISIGFTIGVLSSAASAYLPPGRLAMGSALYATGRQVGGALGIAIVTALVSTAPDRITGYSRVWIYATLVFLSAAIAMAALFRKPTESQLAAASSLM